MTNGTRCHSWTVTAREKKINAEYRGCSSEDENGPQVLEKVRSVEEIRWNGLPLSLSSPKKNLKLKFKQDAQGGSPDCELSSRTLLAET